jgi:hypothetical protein
VYLQLRNVLDETNPAHAEVFNDIKRRFREEMFTWESIQQVIYATRNWYVLTYSQEVYSKITKGLDIFMRVSLVVDSYALCELCYGSLSGCG